MMFNYEWKTVLQKKVRYACRRDGNRSYNKLYLEIV